jgi:hypothetical protein
MSKWVAFLDAAKIRARVVFPHWRGPSNAVIGDRAKAISSRLRKAGRWMGAFIILKYRMLTPKFQ